MNLKLLSHAEQVAEHLRTEILRGRWTGIMPGAVALQKELDTNHNTIDLALKQLEGEGVLVSQGVGKARRIQLPKGGLRTKLRIQILQYDSDVHKSDYLIELGHQLRDLGHVVNFAMKTLHDLGMSARRVANFVNKTEADAWIVISGSKDVLEWFIKNEIPTFALFGRMVNLPIAATGPKKSTAIIEAVCKLSAWGHRRMVMVTRADRRKPEPGFLERAFLGELNAQGIATSCFNLPDWEETREGFHKLLDSLFAKTPPTALFFSGVRLFLVAQLYLARRGIVAPHDVSLICMDDDDSFSWFDPPISHVRLDSKPWIRRILQWANNISRGKNDTGNAPTPAELIEGGTIGPVPVGKKFL